MTCLPSPEPSLTNPQRKSKCNPESSNLAFLLGLFSKYLLVYSFFLHLFLAFLFVFVCDIKLHFIFDDATARVLIAILIKQRQVLGKLHSSGSKR